MTQHVAPASIDNYTTALRLALDDKLFFAPHIPEDVSVFVDYGCADGSLLLGVMREVLGRPGYGQNEYLGYDHNPEMVRAANAKTSYDPAFRFFGNLPSLKDALDLRHKQGRKSCLILSSVVHEILSQDGVSFETFWDVVRSLGCDYVAFRDMALEVRTLIEPTPTGWYGSAFVREDAEDIAKALSFEAVYGSLQDKENFLHFLLKVIHPTEDWEKELAEDYLPLTAEAYLNRMTVGSGYKLRHFAHTALPGLQARWFQEFGIRVNDPTHVKIVLKKGW